MNIFQYRYIRKQLKVAEKQELYVRNSIPILSKAASICILCCYESDEQIIDILQTINQYQGQIKKIRLLVYLPVKKTPQILQRSLFIQPISKNDISFFGKFKSEAKHDIQTHDYDILINTVTGSHATIADYISTFIHVDFKITCSLKNTNLYHLTLQLEENQSLAYYLDTIEKYTLKLNGK